MASIWLILQENIEAKVNQLDLSQIPDSKDMEKNTVVVLNHLISDNFKQIGSTWKNKQRKGL